MIDIKQLAPLEAPVSQDELDKALAEMAQDSFDAFYVSKSDKVREAQGKLLALSKRPRKPSAPLPGWMQEPELKRWQIDHMACARLMGRNSIFSACSLEPDMPGAIDTLAVQFMREMRQVDVKTCVLLGDTGRGKTWAMVATMASHAHIGRDNQVVNYARFVTANALCEALLSRKPDDIAQYKIAPVLGIDELGCEPKEGFYKDFIPMFESFYSDRHRDGKTTYITSNMTGEQFKARYQERVASRLNADGAILEVIDRNYREAAQ